MTEKIIKARTVHKTLTELEWLSSDYIPRQGEIIIYKAETEAYFSGLSEDNKNLLGRTSPIKTPRTKVGDGEANASILPFASQTSKIHQVNDLSEITDRTHGDIAIVVTPGKQGNHSRTAYIWDSYANEGTGDWIAFDGNYNASSIYTDNDIIIAGDYESIGNYKMNDKIPAGTSLQKILNEMFQKAIQPTKTNPSASISVSGSDGAYETGSSYNLPTASLTVKTGSYTNEGTNTGVVYAVGDVVIAYGADPDVATYTVSNADTLENDGKVSIAPAIYSKDATTALFTDDFVSYTFSGKAGHSTGNIAKDNLGQNSSPVIQIAANDSLTIENKTAKFRGYRKMFCGCTSNELDSDVIRSLNLKATKATTDAFEVTAPIGATKIVVAAPTKSSGKKYTLGKAEMFTSSWEDYTQEFGTAQRVQVADVRGGQNGLQNYNVYIYTFAALKADTKFRITLASTNV